MRKTYSLLLIYILRVQKYNFNFILANNSLYFFRKF